MPGPLSGYRILDLSAVVSGPMAAMLLAEQGAEVIKVEPKRGDVTRMGPFTRNQLASLYLNLNRGKRSIVLDTSKPRGREILLEFAKHSDVLLQNFRPGAMERLGLGESDVRAVNPDIVYASISGFGDSGPYKDRRVYDPVIQGLTGAVAVQLNPEVPIPDLVRHIVADKATALTTAQAITAALLARADGQGGQSIHVPMLDVGLSFFWPDGMMGKTLLGDEIQVPGPTLAQVYALTETADGHVVYFAATKDEFIGLLRALDMFERWSEEDWDDVAKRFEYLQELAGAISDAFRGQRSADVLARLVGEDVPCGPVLSLDEVPQDAQVKHNGVIEEVDHPHAGTMRVCKQAARFSKTPSELGRPAPAFGEHTDELLAELGLAPAEIAELRSDSIAL